LASKSRIIVTTGLIAAGAATTAIFTGCQCNPPSACEPDTFTGPACPVTIVSGSEFPGIGATGVYHRTTVEAKLTELDETATVTLFEAGSEVPGTLETDGTHMVFTPDEPLSPSTDYDVVVDYCAGTPMWTFTTSEVGGATDATALPDRTFNLDVASGRFVKPEGVGPLLAEYLTSLLIGVQTVDGTNVQMMGAVAEADTTPVAQAPCTSTIPFPTADLSDNPYFKVGPQTTVLQLAGYDIPVQDLFISGSFAPDGSYIQGAVLSGLIDTRPLVPLIDETGGPDAICLLAEGIGVACEPCSDGEDLCLSLEVDSMSATHEPGLILTGIHSPVADPVPENSTNYCDNPVCSAEEACL